MEPARGQRPRVSLNQDHPEPAFVGTLVLTSGLRFPLGQRSGLQLFSGKKKESLFKVGQKMPFFPFCPCSPTYRAKRRENPHLHVPWPELWNQVTCPGWGVPAAAAAASSGSTFPSCFCCCECCRALARQVLLLSCERWVSSNSRLRDGESWVAFSTNQAKITDEFF